MDEIKLILGAFILLLVSAQVNAALNYGIGSSATGGISIYSIDIGTGASSELFSAPLFQDSGLAISPALVPKPPTNVIVN